MEDRQPFAGLLIHIFCRCGHSSRVPYAKFGHLLRHDILRLARCTACGKREAVDLIVSGSHLPAHHLPIRG